MALFIDLSPMKSPEDRKRLKEFGKLLQKFRKAKGYSSYHLAALTDKDHSQILHYEAGDVDPTMSTIFRLAEALDINPADLLPK